MDFSMRDAMKGTVAWSVGECTEALKWYYQLLQTPKDDWDLTPRGGAIKDKTGRICQFNLNMLNPKNQISKHLSERYGNMAAYHSSRLQNIVDFLRDYSQKLEAEELGKQTDSGFEPCKELMEALCRLPYSKREIVNDQMYHRFKYKEVIAKARELLGEDK